ncbi:MAG: Ig-like domain-containing protein, partial [Limisphaerales bacterium]
IELLASVSGSQETVARVDFYSNGHLVGSDAESPYGLVFTNATVGEHRLVAKAVERDDRVSESQSVRITVHESLVPLLLPPRVLPTGEVVFNYTGSGLASFVLTRSTNITQVPWQYVLPIRGAGIYVEAPDPAGSQAYYRAERQQ